MYSRLPGTDACAVPVLTPKEAAAQGPPPPDFHPRVTSQSANQSSQKFKSAGNFMLEPGLHTEEVLREAGLNEREILRLSLDGALGEKVRKSAQVNVKL